MGPPVFLLLSSSFTDVIHVSFDSLTIQNPKMRTVTMIDFSSHLLWLSPSPSKTDLRDFDYVTGNAWFAWHWDHNVPLYMERSVTFFMFSMTFSAYLVQAVSHVTLHDDVSWHFTRLYLKFMYCERNFEWNTWLINNHSFVLVENEMVDSQRGAL